MNIPVQHIDAEELQDGCERIRHQVAPVTDLAVVSIIFAYYMIAQ